MVTANRGRLARRAIQCFIEQHHANRELVVVDDGTEDYRPLLRIAARFAPVTYVKLEPTSRFSLGELRNTAIESAQGDWCIQWDDDEWYHPDRIGRQLAAATATGAGASALKWTLMTIPTERQELRFRTSTGIATPGTLLFRRSELRYPPIAKNEDGIFLRDVSRELGLAVLGRESSHLFIRVFHGNNTWDQRHFQRRLWRTPVDALDYSIAKVIHHDITRHHAFRLNNDERETFANFDAYIAAQNGTFHPARVSA